MNLLEEKSLALFFENRRLSPLSVEKNPVGFCSSCDNELESLAYHRAEAVWLVSARCINGHLVLMRFDGEWNWLGDEGLEMFSGFSSVSNLPKEQLEAVFTAAEIRTLIACEKGQPFTRQNLYRARAKFERFEKLFGIRIDI